MFTVCFDLLSNAFTVIAAFIILSPMIASQDRVTIHCVYDEQKKRPSDGQQKNKTFDPVLSIAVAALSKPVANVNQTYSIHYCLIALPCVVTKTQPKCHTTQLTQTNKLKQEKIEFIFDVF